MNNKLNIQFNCKYQLTGKLSLTAKLKLLKKGGYDYIRINNGIVYSSNSNSPCAIDLIVDQLNPDFKDSITTIQIDESNYYILVIRDKKVLLSDIFSQTHTDSKVRLYTINKDFQPSLYAYGYSFEGINEDGVDNIESNPFNQTILKQYRFDKKITLAKKTKRPIIVGGIAAIAVIIALCGTKVSLTHQAKIKQEQMARGQQIVIDQWKNYKQAIFKVTPIEVLPVVFKDAERITETPGIVVSSIDCSDKTLSMELINEGNSEQLVNHQLTKMGFKTDITGMLFDISKPISVTPSNPYFKHHMVSSKEVKTELLDYLAVAGGPVTVKQDPTVDNNQYSTTTFTLSFDNAPYDFIINLFKSINNYPITFNTLTGRTILTGFTGDISINLIGDKS